MTNPAKLEPTPDFLVSIGFPAAGIVFHDGKWWEPDCIRAVKRGDFYYMGYKTVGKASFDHEPWQLSLILKPALFPARPDVPPEGYEWDGDVPVKIGFDREYYVGNGGTTPGDWRWPLKRKPVVEAIAPVQEPPKAEAKAEPVVRHWASPHGLQYAKTENGLITENSTGNDLGLAIATDCWNEISAAEYESARRAALCKGEKVSDAVAPTSAAHTGLNPENLSPEILATMPPGARLLESEEERDAFVGSGKGTYAYSFNLVRWLEQDHVCQLNERFTYCTTRPRGWWKAGKAAEAVKPIQPLTSAEDGWFSEPEVAARVNELVAAVNELRAEVAEMRRGGVA